MASPQIRVDQAHCNYHLARHLSARNADVLYTDAGRVTRGGVGLKGEVLNVFEQNSWPIPDIVALEAGGTLLIVEIDSVFTKAAASLASYHASRRNILQSFKPILEEAGKGDANQLALAFCRTNIANLSAQATLQRLAAAETHVDRWFVFTDARTPLLLELIPVANDDAE